MEIKCNATGAFNSPVEFEITIGECHICKKENVIILCSGIGVGEYGFAKICTTCIKAEINKFNTE